MDRVEEHPFDATLMGHDLLPARNTGDRVYLSETLAVSKRFHHYKASDTAGK